MDQKKIPLHILRNVCSDSGMYSTIFVQNWTFQLSGVLKWQSTMQLGPPARDPLYASMLAQALEVIGLLLKSWYHP